MLYYVLKVVLSAILIVVISEVAQRSPRLGGLLASLPLVSLLALIWLYLDTRDGAQVAALSRSIFWLVLPSLSFFLALPFLLKRFDFPAALGLSLLLMLALYGALALVLARAGITL